MPTEVLVALISAGVPALVTIISHIAGSNDFKRHAARQSILQMILEDKVSWYVDHDFPVNYGSVCDEFAEYKKKGGNGATAKKVEEYKEWYAKVESELRENVIAPPVLWTTPEKEKEK